MHDLICTKVTHKDRGVAWFSKSIKRQKVIDVFRSQSLAHATHSYWIPIPSLSLICLFLVNKSEMIGLHNKTYPSTNNFLALLENHFICALF